MPSHYKKVPDSTKPKKFPEPRKEPHQYKEPIGPQKPPGVGSRILSDLGAFAHTFAPKVEKAQRTGGKVQRYAARRTSAIDNNLVRGGGAPLPFSGNPMNMGQGWMNMSFTGSGFGQQTSTPRRLAAPAPRRKRRKSRQRHHDDGGWGLPLY